MDLFLIIGLIFALAGTKGVLKMPDAFSRMQASTCIATLGVIGVVIGGLIYAIGVMHSANAAVKIAVIGLLILVTNQVLAPTLSWVTASPRIGKAAPRAATGMML